ncbi:hypothetical protein HHI36_015153 [Cryptolaemus montrouzieri]|uniref:Mitochondrial carrier protein n=1 Tax=Cryptolaemus montrouzieri TaxID=559131 RepID=A0ABD2N605_9CUCU
MSYCRIILLVYISKRSVKILNWRDFVAGWAASTMSTTLVYPVTKIISRQMLFGVYPHTAVFQMKKEGLKYLFRGILPQLYQRTLQTSIMFGIFEGSKSYMKTKYNISNRTSLLLAAALAGSCESILTPFERVQILLIDPNNYYRFKNTCETVNKIVRNNGLKEFYRGYTVILVRNVANTCAYFFLKEELIPKELPFESAAVRTAIKFGAGALIGAMVTTTTFPLNVVKIASQRVIGGDNRSPWQVYRTIYKLRGRRFTRMYLGGYPNYLRALLQWGLIQVTYDHLKPLLYEI